MKTNLDFEEPSYIKKPLADNNLCFNVCKSESTGEELKSCMGLRLGLLKCNLDFFIVFGL